VNDDDLDGHRRMGAAAFNRAWELLDLTEREPEQNDEMLAATFAQRHHWYVAGDARNRAIADWQVSRVTAVLGQADLARHYAERSLGESHDQDLDSFVIAYAHEALARALHLAGDTAGCERHRTAALALADAIADVEDRRRLLEDLEDL
jgi:hypothetical protein